MAKRLVHTVKVVRVGGLSDEELKLALNVPEDHHVLRGVREVMDRLDDHYDNSFCDIGASPQVRSDAGILKAGIREIRRAIQDWNQAGKQPQT